MKGWFLIERADGTEYFVCKKCGHSADVPYDRCPECGGEETMINKAHLRPKDFDSNGDIIPMACKEEKGDLISRNALIQHAYSAVVDGVEKDIIDLSDVDNAPTVEYTFEEAFQKTVCEQRLYCPKRPKGEYEFIEILAQYVPDDICTYPEYKGKPYYSIHYKQNGEEFVGFGTYNPEVLSRYLKEYFMKGGAPIGYIHQDILPL